MFKYSKTSLKRLLTCHKDLQVLLSEALKNSPFDISILCGYRSKKEQNDAYNTGNSQLKYPHSKHNSNPSIAVDIAPYPIDWDDINRFVILSEHIKKTADDLGINVQWGGDWKNFKDYPHWELKNA